MSRNEGGYRMGLAEALRIAATVPVGADEAAMLIRKEAFRVLHQAGQGLCRELAGLTRKRSGVAGADLPGEWTDRVSRQLLRLMERGIAAKRDLPATDSGARAYLRTMLLSARIDEARSPWDKRRVSLDAPDEANEGAPRPEPADPESAGPVSTVEAGAGAMEAHGAVQRSLEQLRDARKAALRKLPLPVRKTLSSALPLMERHLLEAFSNQLGSDDDWERRLESIVESLHMLSCVIAEAASELLHDRHQLEFATGLEHLFLIYFRSETYGSLAASLGVSQAALRKRLQRVRDRVEKRVVQNEEGSESRAVASLKRLIDTMKLAARDAEDDGSSEEP